MSACGGPTLPEYAMLISLEDSVVARRSTNEINLAVHVRMSNRDSRTVFYDGCGHALQRRDGTNWRAVYSPRCAPSAYSLALSPGESRTVSIVAREPASSTAWPSADAAGEYRVVLWLSATPRNVHGFRPQPLAPASRTSPVFSIRVVDVEY
jgi:hypothetical protein